MSRRHGLAVLVGVGVLAGAGGGLAVAASGGPTDEGPTAPNPAAAAALALPTSAVDLFVDSATGDVCVITRADRARGSSCTQADAKDVLLSKTVSEVGFAIGVFDPTQRAAAIVVDGEKASALTNAGRDHAYFAVKGTQLPKELRVQTANGEDLLVVHPESDEKAARAAASEAPKH